MNSLVVSSACWTRRRSAPSSSRAARVALVRTSRSTISAWSAMLAIALGRSVVQLADDVATQVLLAAQRQHGLVAAARRCGAAAIASGRRPGDAIGAGRLGRPPHARQAVVDLDEPLQEAGQDALLALEHLALGVEEQLDRRVSARRLVRISRDLVLVGVGVSSRGLRAGSPSCFAAPRGARSR